VRTGAVVFSWLCRATNQRIGGAADPATSSVNVPVVATSSSRRATMHGAAQTFRRASEIGTAKSVSFKKNSVKFKISLQKVLKIKKNPYGDGWMDSVDPCAIGGTAPGHAVRASRSCCLARRAYPSALAAAACAACPHAPDVRSWAGPRARLAAWGSAGRWGLSSAWETAILNLCSLHAVTTSLP